ncbi:hypothetical protein ACH5RR_032394 [Cinchona calisaya]|uniref:Uncharacterized protein n=1 Tax=Cinchona calisaya TaxID=153742 RepID=A0ABD2YHY7_9GENT
MLDSSTVSLSRPNVACFCVEINVQKPLLKRFYIGKEVTARWQHIDYENVPSYCISCYKLGHKLKEHELHKNPRTSNDDDAKGDAKGGEVAAHPTTRGKEKIDSILENSIVKGKSRTAMHVDVIAPQALPSNPIADIVPMDVMVVVPLLLSHEAELTLHCHPFSHEDNNLALIC